MTQKLTTFEVRARETTSEAVIRAVSDVRGVDPLDMDACLYDAIDPSVLDAVFEPGETGAVDENRQLTFTFDGCEVTVDGDGQVTVTVVERRAKTTATTGPSPAVFRGDASPWQLVFQ